MKEGGKKKPESYPRCLHQSIPDPRYLQAIGRKAVSDWPRVVKDQGNNLGCREKKGEREEDLLRGENPLVFGRVWRQRLLSMVFFPPSAEM